MHILQACECGGKASNHTCEVAEHGQPLATPSRVRGRDDGDSGDLDGDDDGQIAQQHPMNGTTPDRAEPPKERERPSVRGHIDLDTQVEGTNIYI